MKPCYQITAAPDADGALRLVSALARPQPRKNLTTTYAGDFLGVLILWIDMMDTRSAAQIYIDEMPRRAAIFLALFANNINKVATAWANVYGDRNTDAAEKKRLYYIAVENVLLADQHAKVWLPLSQTSSGGLRASPAQLALAPYVNAFVDCFPKSNPLKKLVSEVETLLERQRLFALGARVPAFKPFLFIEGKTSYQQIREPLTVGSVRRERQRSEKAALAVATYSAVQSVPEGRTTRKAVQADLAWSSVKRRALVTSNNAKLLSAAVTALVEAFWDGDTRLDSLNDGATARLFAEYYRKADILERMELSTLMATICPMTPKGIAYLKHVARAPQSDLIGDAFFADLINSQNVHLFSPIHIDRLRELSESFTFPDPASPATELVPNPDAIAWGGASAPARQSNIQKAISAAKAINGGITKIKSTADAAINSLTIVYDFGVGPNASYLERVNSYHKLNTLSLDPRNTPPDTKTKLTGAWKFVTAVNGLRKTIESNNKKAEWGADELIATAKSTVSVVDAVTAFGDLYSTKSSLGRAVSPSFTRLFGITGVVFSVIDLSFHFKKLFQTSNTGAQAAIVVEAGGQALAAVSVLMGGLRTIPHPAAFALGLLGEIIIYFAGWYQKVAAADDMRALLKNSYFSKLSGKTRRRNIIDEWIKELLLIQGGGANLAAAASNDDGMHSLEFMFFFIRDFDAATSVDAFVAANVPKMQENWLRQIAVIYAASGALSLIDGRNGGFRTFDTSRKVAKTGDADRDKARLQKGSTLTFYDVSHDRSHNASTLGQSIGVFEPLALSVSGASSGSVEWDKAETHIMGQPTPANVDVTKGGLTRPDVLEAQVKLPVPAWAMPYGANGPKMRLVARVRLS